MNEKPKKPKDPISKKTDFFDLKKYYERKGHILKEQLLL